MKSVRPNEKRIATTGARAFQATRWQPMKNFGSPILGR